MSLAYDNADHARTPISGGIFGFTAQQAYSAGEIVTYAGSIYKAKADITAAPWNPVNWEEISPNAPQYIDLNTPGGADIGAAWTAWAGVNVTNVRTSVIVIASFGTPVSKFVLKNLAHPELEASWERLSTDLDLANAAEVLAGSNGTKVITPATLQSRVLVAPTATPANDANHLVILDAAGHIAPGFLGLASSVFTLAGPHADNAAALAANLVAGNLYYTATGEVRIVV